MKRKEVWTTHWLFFWQSVVGVTPLRHSWLLMQVVHPRSIENVRFAPQVMVIESINFTAHREFIETNSLRNLTCSLSSLIPPLIGNVSFDDKDSNAHVTFVISLPKLIHKTLFCFRKPTEDHHLRISVFIVSLAINMNFELQTLLALLICHWSR